MPELIIIEDPSTGAELEFEDCTLTHYVKRDDGTVILDESPVCRITGKRCLYGITTDEVLDHCPLWSGALKITKRKDDGKKKT